MAGYVAENILSGRAEFIAYEQLPAAVKAGALVLDVSTAGEYEAGHIPEAINIPVDELRQRLSELRVDQPLVVYCKVGIRGYLAERILKQQGFSVKNLMGGYTSVLQQQ